MLYFAFFNFLCNHFVLVGRSKINLNFYKYNGITRTDGSSNIIDKFYAYYFGNYVTLRKEFRQKNDDVLHAKINLNLHLGKKASRALNFLNVSEMETYWIKFVVIGLLIVKGFLKHNINIVMHIFFIQLFLSHLTLYWSEKRFNHHSKIRSCTTKKYFLIVLINNCDDLNNENQYLCLQLNCLNQIKSKISFSI